MTEKQRLCAVYRGETPDRVPFFLDLSHWFYHKHRIPFDLSVAHVEAETDLLDFHKRVGAGFYASNLNSYYEVTYAPEVLESIDKCRTGDDLEIVWRIETPLGSIERRRRWEPGSYSWSVSRWGVRSEQDLRVLAYALSRRIYTPAWERYLEWVRAAQDNGVVYMPVGSTALGFLLGHWMGTEATVFAAVDMNSVMHAVVDQINQNWLACVDLVCQSPAEVIFMGDNFSSDIQSPAFFREWSEPYYREAVRRVQRAGKYTAVHIDGRLQGLLGVFADMGVSCADAVTPAPMGDLSPQQCRNEAGSELILSGGVPPIHWMPGPTDEGFAQCVLDWLETRKMSPRLVANAGDQVPPGAPEYRIAMMRDLVDEHGQF